MKYSCLLSPIKVPRTEYDTVVCNKGGLSTERDDTWT
jgi:hypothetical protein